MQDATLAITVVPTEPHPEKRWRNGAAIEIHQRDGKRWKRGQELTAPKGRLFRQDALALSGESMIVGGRTKPDEEAPGAAFIYRRDGGRWTLEEMLVDESGAALDEFGVAVDIVGDTALVGASYTDRVGENSGTAFVFTRSDGQWTLQATLAPKDVSAHDHFGGRVLLLDDLALVAATEDDDEGGNTGSVFIYARRGTKWTRQAKLTSGSGVYEDAFGWSMSESKGTVVIGAPGYDQGLGAVYVFVRRGNRLVKQARLTPSDGKAYRSGWSVAIDGDRVYVGAPQSEHPRGAVVVFERSGARWKQTHTLTVPKSAFQAELGNTVAAHPDGVLCAAPGDIFTSKAVDGAVFDFRPQADGTWLLANTLFTRHAK